MNERLAKRDIEAVQGVLLFGELRMQKSALWTIPGIVSLILFALALTRVDSAHAGRAYAAYGGIYILSSLLWLWASRTGVPITGTFWEQPFAGPERPHPVRAARCLIVTARTLANQVPYWVLMAHSCQPDSPPCARSPKPRRRT